MKSRLYLVLSLVLVFNASLVAVSAFLAHRSSQQYPMSGQLIVVDDVAIHVVDSGPPSSATVAASDSYPTLVLLHGASTSLLDFETSIKPGLARHARVISIDRPGHGYSERGRPIELAKTLALQPAEQEPWVNPHIQARLIAATLRELKIQHSIWIGHSWAGAVVLAGMLDDTAGVSAGVLIAGATHPWKGDSAWHVQVAASPVIGRIFSWQYIEPIGRLAMANAVASVFTPEQVPDTYIKDTGLVLSLRPEIYRNNASDLTRLSQFLETQSQRYTELRQPILSITGSGDNVVPSWNHDKRLARQVPQLQSMELAGAGHAPHHTRSDEVVRIIEEFIASQAP